MFLLVDCNNFFVSCERLFRPDISKCPVVVLSSNDGCAISRSQEAKDLGIQMGIPYFEIKNFAEKHKVHIFSSNFVLYRDISKRVIEAVSSLSDDVSQYSIDEAFVVADEKDAEHLAKAIRERVYQWVGIPVSVGVAPTMTLAKFANQRAKKGTGVSVLKEPKDDALLLSASVRELWGVGRKSAEKLEADGIKTIVDILICGKSALRQLLGVNGERLYFEVSGVSAPHIATVDSNHSLMSTRSFGKVVTEKTVLEGALTHHITHLGESLRRKKLGASVVTVELRVKRQGQIRGSGVCARLPLLHPTNDTQILLKCVLGLMSEMYVRGERYVKAGVVVSGLTPDYVSQGDLFSDSARSGSILMETIDAITDKYGDEAMHYGTLNGTRLWRSKTERLSPRYTTSWKDIKTIKTL